MKKLSIKMKVTIWYTVFVAIVALFALGVVALYAGRMIWSEQEKELREEVAEFAEELEVSGSGYVTEEGRFYDDDIVFSLYNESGALLDGNVPASFPENTTLKNGVVQTISSGEQEWLTYDIAVDYGGDHMVWVRGITYMGLAMTMSGGLLIVSCILIPVLVVLAAAGGFIITKRAFKPVEDIQRTAAEIAGSKDLARRMPTEEASGEIRELAETFNGMLGTLESTLEDEKRFTADVSHELRTPVSVIMAQGEYAMLEDSTEEERKEALEIIVGQAKKMSAMIAQLLEMARREKSAGPAGREKVDLGEIVNLAAEELKDLSGEKRITITSDSEQELYVWGEQTAFTRIFMNLVTNAVQYGKEGGHVWLKAWKEGEEVLCSVRDDGIGIGPEELPHIFRRFYREDKSRTGRAEAHAGLGLSMVKHLTENFGGTIQVYSQKEKGTTFVLHFPALRNPDNPLQ
ncbi:HAMP domain-containing histidine kinase [Lachnospiraceae bacterium KGMB03038]|nr:HAMP domain-containing histidine kinase [Lachnospiraceae bacterium KGMB03038]